MNKKREEEKKAYCCVKKMSEHVKRVFFLRSLQNIANMSMINICFYFINSLSKN